MKYIVTIILCLLIGCSKPHTHDPGVEIPIEGMEVIYIDEPSVIVVRERGDIKSIITIENGKPKILYSFKE